MSDAREPLPVPRSFRDRVSRTSGGWKVETPFSDYHLVVLAGAGGAFAAIPTAMICFSLIGKLFVIALGPSAGVVAGFGSAGIAAVMLVAVPLAIAFGLGTSEVLRIGARGAVLSGMNRRLHRPDRVEVRGAPGWKTTIDVGPETLLTLRHEDARTGWDHDAITWLVAEMGRIWDVPVDDHRDLAEFEAFDTDPLARARIEWANELAENRERYPGFHVLPPQEPDHQADLDGLTMTAYRQRTEQHVVRLTPEHLELHGDAIPLTTIDDVRVTFGDQEAERAWRHCGMSRSPSGSGARCGW